MQTLIVVNINCNLTKEGREELREKMMKEMEEGLLIIDDSLTVTYHNIQGKIGLEFNKEGK